MLPVVFSHLSVVSSVFSNVFNVFKAQWHSGTVWHMSLRPALFGPWVEAIWKPILRLPAGSRCRKNLIDPIQTYKAYYMYRLYVIINYYI